MVGACCQEFTSSVCVVRVMAGVMLPDVLSAKLTPISLIIAALVAITNLLASYYEACRSSCQICVDPSSPSSPGSHYHRSSEGSAARWYPLPPALYPHYR